MKTTLVATIVARLAGLALCGGSNVLEQDRAEDLRRAFDGAVSEDFLLCIVRVPK